MKIQLNNEYTYEKYWENDKDFGLSSLSFSLSLHIQATYDNDITLIKIKNIFNHAKVNQEH